MDKLFELLQQQPALSISLGFILALVLVIILKDQIRKKFTDYYSVKEIREAIKVAQYSEIESLRRDSDIFENDVIDYLKLK